PPRRPARSPDGTHNQNAPEDLASHGKSGSSPPLNLEEVSDPDPFHRQNAHLVQQPEQGGVQRFHLQSPSGVTQGELPPGNPHAQNREWKETCVEASEKTSRSEERRVGKEGRPGR